MYGIAGFKEDSSIENPDALITRMLSHVKRRGPNVNKNRGFFQFKNNTSDVPTIRIDDLI